jgi:MoCo/4Fe-4S cofactor protein with predicted Tat translocation signal
MKEPSNKLPASVTGRRYWRSLDELSDTPEFKDWLHREFPQGASEFTDPVSRRHFIKIMSASFALAGLGLAATGCRRPVEELVPFSKAPQNGYDYGMPEYFATAMPTRAGAVPLVVKSYGGRPIKIEGNAQFPGANGGTDRYAQASILNLYDPDRAQRFAKDGRTVSRDEALDFLGQLSKKIASEGGQGLHILAESSTSPSRQRMQRLLSDKFPSVGWCVYDAIDSDVFQRAASLSFGQPLRPLFHFDRAKIILSLDCDFIGGEDDAHNYIAGFARGRKPESGGMSRLYAVESLFTLTGASADHRLRVPASLVGQIGAAIAAQIANSTSLVPADINPRWISECAKDLMAHRGEVLVVAGQRQPLEVHLLAQQMNSLLGSLNKTVEFLPVNLQPGSPIAKLAGELNSGKVETLVILGGNPVYNAPAGLDWAAAQRKAKTVIRLGYYEDETFPQCDWHFPAAHYLESWGDATTSDGMMVPVQPLIEPLFGGLTELEFLARLAGESPTQPRDIVRRTFGGSDENWKMFLFNGFKVDSATGAISVSAAAAAPNLQKVTAPSAKSLEVVFYRDAKMDDGRYTNNGWMQELPDPITKMTWDNAVLVSRKTARELGVQNGDIVEIALNGRNVKGPIWTQPGMADYSLGMALGYGRERAGRVGGGVGFDAYKIFTGKYIETGATLRKVGSNYSFACTQDHWSMEGRPAVREANWDGFKNNPEFAKEMHDKAPPVVEPLYPNPLDEAEKTALQQWGLVVDLTACVGCATCVVACQSENNIPIVGKDQVRRGREMHWMRIDRYYTADPAKETWNDSMLKDSGQQFEQWIDNVQAVNQPMLCQMCEAAPCENVCPVNATTHDQEGLNVMIYNRCVGTRYCSNNCPYKVRRFNYLDYNKRPLADLKGPFYPTPLTHETNGKWDMISWWNHPDTSSMRPEDEWDLLKMVMNPDVTVRMRGVMEKCTYCIQRIQHAEIAQKVKAGPSGDVRLKESEGTIPKTACQQACPAQAIVFGDISDPDSTVSKWKGYDRNYAVLGDLLVKPRTTYLARIRNPNPAMPDYHKPYSTEEYENHGGEFQAVEKGNS